jgi:hypothetical protein
MPSVMTDEDLAQLSPTNIASQEKEERQIPKSALAT